MARFKNNCSNRPSVLDYLRAFLKVFYSRKPSSDVDGYSNGKRRRAPRCIKRCEG